MYLFAFFLDMSNDPIYLFTLLISFSFQFLKLIA